MGVIQRQGIKNTLISYVGVVLGAIAILFIYQIDNEIYGYAQFLIGTATFLFPFAAFGVNSLVVKFYPFYAKNQRDDQGYLIMISLFYHLAFLLFLIIFFSFQNFIFDGLKNIGVDKNGLIKSNLRFILPMLYFMGVWTLLYAHSSNIRRIVVPDIIGGLSRKILLPIFVLLYVWAVINKDQFANLLVLFYVLICITLTFYLLRLKAFKLSLVIFRNLSSKRLKEMTSFSLYGSASQIGSVLAFRIDAIMVSTMINLASNQIYFIMYFLANVISIPTQAINKIAAPIISESWKKDDRNEINKIYKKTSINLIVIGIPMLFIIWFSLATLDIISSENSKFVIGRYVFLLLGIGKIIDMITSVNNQILSLSPKYRYMLLFIVILGVTNITLNYYLIGEFGIEGAAMASCFAIFLFNLFKLVFIWREYGMHPFSDSMVKLFFIILFTTAIIYFAPNFDHVILELIKNLILLGIIYPPLIIYFKIAPDINKLLKMNVREWIK